MDEPVGGRSRHIVVAEDSPTQAELLRQALTEEGFEVTVAPDGAQALEAARRIRPALVVTDIVMPGMNGYELCRALKADPDLGDVPVMIVTSLREVEDIIRALDCGADTLLRKPFDAATLVARFEFLLANRALRSAGTASRGVDIVLGGRRHTVTAGREQMLDLLFSSYQEAVQANEELRERQQEVQSLNLQLAARAAELEDANKQLRAFGHTVSHDLRSPLATIGGFSSMLMRRYAADLAPDVQRYLGAIGQETERMRRIVEDVLYLASIDRARVTRTEVDLAQLARELAGTLAGAHPQRQVRFDCVERAPAFCDERLLRIALTNLLANAWKFTGKRSDAQVAFGMEQLDGEPVFWVADNGAGFDMSSAHRLFKPFERLHRTDEFEGFGVGLATVQRIVTLHGGRIWADAAPGRGARFRFSLGLAQGQQDHKEEKP
ncbi:sensor histidine kinase [Ramlibacter sp.]|uniref:sensor histidine kinase n=1 Tax=Ramlibacter sp. TaxID=1917967 RepID=UPI002D4EC9A0|nr:response regulator [Ramlibacter sp.]HYD75527.1 response regulator [Ramlibacter sp.]